MNEYCYNFKCATRDVLNQAVSFEAKTFRHIETCSIEDGLLDVNFFKKINNLTPIYIMKIFHTPSNTITWAHEDVTNNGDPIKYAINILLSSGDPGAMQWLYTKEKKSYTLNSNGVPCVNYELNEILGLAHTEVISLTPTLVRTDKPHRIVTGTTPRACLSIRCRNNFNSWEEAVLAYKDIGF